MISLKENRAALMNLKGTIAAIDNLDSLIRNYSEQKLGPAYASFNIVDTEYAVQFDRPVIVSALNQQRQRLVEYMEQLGIKVD